VAEALKPRGLVLAGVDSLMVGWPVHSFKFSEEERAVLVAAKQAARERRFGRDGAALTWYGQSLNMKASGTQGYEWILENGDLSIRIAAEAGGGSAFPEVYVTFRSPYLWRGGYQEACRQTLDWLSSWADIGEGKVSRVDLCADFAIALPEIDLKTEVVGRARKRKRYNSINLSVVADWQNGRTGTGYQIGKGDLAARIYDKREELLYTRKNWFEDLWQQNGWDGESQVTRFEFQFRRKMLKELQLDSLRDLEAQIPDLWAYATENWLTARKPSTDTNRTRWPLQDYWKDVQSVGQYFGTRTGTTRVIQRAPQYLAVMRGVRGGFKTLAAFELANGHSDEQALQAMDAVYEWIRSDRSFLEEARQRGARFAFMNTQ